MKAYKNSKLVVWGAVCIFCLAACGESYQYKMTTRINKDGSCERAVYARAYPAFLEGDTSQNPFLFTITPEWKIERLDTTSRERVINEEVVETAENGEIGETGEIDANFKIKIKATRFFKSISDCSPSLQCDEVLSPIVKPAESLQKQFRWFYTYYSFSAIYAAIPDKFPISIDDYMSKDEQKLWFQGDMSNYKGMNGMELNDKLNDIEKKYLTFYARNFYESAWYAIDSVKQKTADTAYLFQINLLKDTLFSIYFKDITKESEFEYEFDPEGICKLLDNHLKIKHFRKMHKANKEEIEQLYSQKMNIVNLFQESLEYELIMPGKIITANAPFTANDTLSWQVDAFRFLANDYLLTAQSRSANVWAFAVTAVLGVLAVFCLGKIKKK